MVSECPALQTQQDVRALIGRFVKIKMAIEKLQDVTVLMILYAWDTEGIQGWFLVCVCFLVFCVCRAILYAWDTEEIKGWLLVCVCVCFLVFFCVCRAILYAWDTEEIKGWFLGRVEGGPEKMTKGERKSMPGIAH